MFRIFYLFFLLLFISNCSLKTNNIKNLSDISFENEISFKQFKKNAIKYGKLKDFPDLD